jgi:hypothetical protein
MSKPRVVKDYEKLDLEVQEQIKLKYPYGFEKHLVTFKNKEGKFVSALPFETEDRYFLIRMSVQKAQDIIEEDDDYDDEGNLKEDIKEEYEEKFAEAEEIPDDSDISDMDDD